MNARSTLTHRSQCPRRTTLLALVQALTKDGYTEQAVETEVLELLDSGQAQLTGSFRSTPLRWTRDVLDGRVDHAKRSRSIQ